MPISKTLLAILACPDCRGDIKYVQAKAKQPEHLVCLNCKRTFAIQDDIPIMMPKNG